MPGLTQRRVFLSYARKDGQGAALRLRDDLEAAGFQVWQDVQAIRGGTSWTKEIEKGLSWCDTLVAVLTPASYQSEFCRAEQLMALDDGKAVIPVMAAPGVQVPIHLYTRNWRKYPDQRAELLEDIRAKKLTRAEPQPPPVLHYDTVPNLPQNHIPRPDLIAQLRDLVFTEGEGGNIAVTALKGMGGIGKTVLAIDLCRDPVVRRAFPDGIAWITLGRESVTDQLSRMREVSRALGDDPTLYDSPLACQNRYRTILREKAALVVIDDVWDVASLEQLLVEAPRSRFVFTTRDSGIANAVAARECAVDLLTNEEARSLLMRWAQPPEEPSPSLVDEIIAECGRLALAIAVVGSSLRAKSAVLWSDTLNLLKEADISTLEQWLPRGQKSFFRSMGVSLQALEQPTLNRYLALAVLIEDLPTPLPVFQTLWKLPESEVRLTASHFVERSLATWNESGGLHLHDLQLDYVRAKHPNSEALALIHAAIRLSAHVILRDPFQFASQVAGRLLLHQHTPAIGQFIRTITEGAPRPRLRPLRPTLTPAGGPARRVLEGHGGAVRAVALAADGKRAASGSVDRTLRVWDLEGNQRPRVLEGHTGPVFAVALTADGKRAVSGSLDRTLQVWDLKGNQPPRVLEGHTDGVSAVALTADCKRAVSGSHDRTLRVWDLEGHQPPRVLEGHVDWVLAVALTADGKRAVSGSEDHTLLLWDLEGNQPPRVLEGHTAAVWAVALTADGKRAVSGSEDGTLRVWDLESHQPPRVLEGHTGQVTAVAVTADGKRVVSGSQDGTLRVWDLESHQPPRVLEGHTDWFWAVALTADAQRAVSGSEDGTLRVWDLEGHQPPRVQEGHTDEVWSVAVTADGKRAVSGSYDHTLRVWDLEGNQPPRVLKGRTAEVRAVALTADGKRAVSGSIDGTIRVWDLEGHRRPRALEGHTDKVQAIALTADGKRAVSGADDHTLRVWNLEGHQPPRVLKGHTNGVTAVALTADGKRAVSGSFDYTLRVWDLEGHQPPRILEGHRSRVWAVALTADGKRAVSGADDDTLVWDLEGNQPPRVLERHRAPVVGVALTADGKRAVSGSWDHTLRVWDVESGNCLTTFTCDDSVLCCAWVGWLVVAGGRRGLHPFAWEE
jgi:WD40 repeat protein